MASPPEPPLDELDDMEVGAALLEDMDEEADMDIESELDMDELSWATAPVAAKAATRATGRMLNFILTSSWDDDGRRMRRSRGLEMVTRRRKGRELR